MDEKKTRCDACHVVQMCESALLKGILVWMCLHPLSCLRRARENGVGMWA